MPEVEDVAAGPRLPRRVEESRSAMPRVKIESDCVSRGRVVSPDRWTGPMAYSAKAVANFVLELGERDRIPVSPMSLQKLVYIAHGWHLAIRSTPLVSDEHPEAWDYGPVFPSLYYEFREFGAKPIGRPASELMLGDDEGWHVVVPSIPVSDPVTQDVVRRVWEQYRHLSGLQLSDLTHQNGSPWYQTRLTASGFRNTPIDSDLIKDHFNELAWKNRESRTRQIA